MVSAVRIAAMFVVEARVIQISRANLPRSYYVYSLTKTHSTASPHTHERLFYAKILIMPWICNPQTLTEG